MIVAYYASVLLSIWVTYYSWAILLTPFVAFPAREVALVLLPVTMVLALGTMAMIVLAEGMHIGRNDAVRAIRRFMTHLNPIAATYRIAVWLWEEVDIQISRRLYRAYTRRR